MVEYIVQDIQFRCTSKPDLFSPKALDIGTQLLIESIASKEIKYTTALDWGCGWGAIGIFLAKNRPQSRVIAIDSDIAAIATTTENAKINEVKNIEVFPSYSFDLVDKTIKFDLIASNPPTHRGREVVEQMIIESKNRLIDNGELWIVIEARLKPWVARVMKNTFGNYRIVTRGPKNVVLRSIKTP